jgi:hypothetical protein
MLLETHTTLPTTHFTCSTTPLNPECTQPSYLYNISYHTKITDKLYLKISTQNNTLHTLSN